MTFKAKTTESNTSKPTEVTASSVLQDLIRHSRNVHAVVISCAWRYQCVRDNLKVKPTKDALAPRPQTCGGRVHKVVIVTTGRSADKLARGINALKDREVLEFASSTFRFRDVLGNAVDPVSGPKLFQCGRATTHVKERARGKTSMVDCIVEEQFECNVHAAVTTTDALFQQQ